MEKDGFEVGGLRIEVLVFLSLILLMVGSVFAEDFLIREQGDGSTYFVVNGSSGNVGVGVNSPLEKLEVDGNINVTSGNDICITGGNCVSSLSSLPGCSDGETLAYNSTSDAWECGNVGDVADLGSVQAFAMDVCPEYWLEADGSSLSTTGTYGDLYLAIGTTYGSGAGTFNLPDYRGYFLRGWDNGAGVDPDAGGRTNAGGGGTGDNIGTKQGYSTAAPATDFVTDDPGSHTHSSGALGGTAFIAAEAYGGTSVAADGRDDFWTGNAGSHSHSISSGGDSESRPLNINVLYCIRALSGDSFGDVDSGNYTFYSVGGSIIVQF